MRFLPSVKIALAVFFIILVAVMTAGFHYLSRSGIAGPSGASGPSLKEAAAVVQALLNERSENLAAKALAFAEAAPLKAVLAVPAPSAAQVADVVREISAALNPAVLVVTNRAGVPLFDSRSNSVPKDAETWPFAAPSLQGSSTRAYFTENGRLYQAVAVPVHAAGKTVGVVTTAYPIDAATASLFKSLTGADVSLFAAGKCLNTTSSQLSPSQADKDLLPFLPGGTRNAAPAPSILHTDILNKRWEASRLDLSGLRTEPAGVLFLLENSAPPAELKGSRPLLAVAGLGLILAGLFSFITVRVFTAPLKRIEKVLERAELGDLKGVVDIPGAHEAAPLAFTVNRFIANWQERELFKNILGKYAPQSTVKKLLASGEPPVLEGERRSVVILVSGIRGFASFTENADPAKLSKGLNEFFTLVSNIVFKHEGMVDKFVGDTVTALWGAPLPQEDAEMRAVRTALEIQEALKNFNGDRVKLNLHPMLVGIGIISGEVVVGNLGSEQNPDYTVIGDEVALARKLAAKATAGQVVVADSAFQKVKDRVEVNPLAPIVQKGIAARGFGDPIKIHVVTDLKK